MKTRIIAFLLLVSVLGLKSQLPQPCGTTEMMNKWMAENPDKAKDFLKLQQEADEQDKKDFSHNYSGQRLSSTPAYTIPVVFHIIHLNGPENISDAQVYDAMRILNEDYRKLNSDTTAIVPEFKALAADVNFQFQLATKDEYGNCTSGITRHYDTRTYWDANLLNYVYTWDRTKYLNVYVVKTISNGAAGYTFLPGSVGPSADAIVIRHDYTGSIGTGFPFGARSLTHEVGHWFNLQHIWGNNNNAGVACGDDGVTDTPITKGFTYCNLSGSAICNPPIKENVQNYMDYSFCSKMFTIGQATRMNNAALSATAGRNNLHSTSNLIATGIINPVSPCAPIANFMANQAEVCVNTNVGFTDLSYNGTITNWNWTFNGGSSVNPTLQNPTATFSLSGLRGVQLKVSNSVGADSVLKKLVTVLPGPGTGTNNIVQSFETITLPDNLWITNIPTTGAGWIQTSTVAATGSKCILVDNYFDSPSDPAVLYTPMYDVSALPNPALTFNVAYSQNSSGSNDRLRVYYSTDCAASWNTLYNHSGSLLHTLGSGVYASGAFLNPSSSQWRKEYVSLSGVSAANNLLLKFEFTKDSLNPGNNIFLDDINVESITGIQESALNSNWIVVSPNPAKTIVKLNFNYLKEADLKTEILDVVGKPVMCMEKSELKKGINDIDINISTLSSGLYFIKLNIENNYFIKKLIVE